MLQQKDKTAKEIEKLTKQARIATIRSLIPRELYKHQDTYDNEIEKVYNYKNMTDKEIADVYQTKLRSIDLGKRITEQHKASANNNNNAIMRRDPYSHFRDVPQFHTAASLDQQNKVRSSNVMKHYGLMKKITGSGFNA